ncbi:nucleoside 2-deoxyribosyltransferase [Bradyrhizobium elkanii]|nr:nucleoside 2-deoxyribosyltransferase [Bradyrhizobium elkanii]
MVKPKTRVLLYLACPYTDPSAAVRLERFNQATKAAAALIRQGHIVFSPITMTHPIDIEMVGTENTLGSEFWVAFDEAFMERCDAFVLLPLDRWEESSGVRREIEFFQKAGKPLMVVDDQFKLKPLKAH